MIKRIYEFLINKVKTSNNYVFFESAFYIYDNTFALYKYMKKNYCKKRLLYYCSRKKQCLDAMNKGIRKKDIIVKNYTGNKIKSIINRVRTDYYVRKCGLAFCSYRMDEYKNRDNNKENRRVVFLWHATLIFKSLNCGFSYHFPKKENNMFFVNPTKETERLYLECEPELKNAQFVIAGKPRNDLIFHPKLNAFSKIIGNSYKGQNVILCACTFREMDSRPSDFFRKEFPLVMTNDDLERLNMHLQKTNTILLIKAHHAQNIDGISLYTNIVIKGQDDFVYNNIEVEEIFSLTQGLITDYSSIYFDYLLCNKPTAFIKCDDEYYKKIRGFSSKEIMEMRIGYSIYNIDDLIKTIDKMCTKDDPYETAKNNLSLKINGNYGDKNCESICRLFVD